MGSGGFEAPARNRPSTGGSFPSSAWSSSWAPSFRAGGAGQMLGDPDHGMARGAAATVPHGLGRPKATGAAPGSLDKAR